MRFLIIFLISPGNGIYYSVVQKTCPTNTESAEFSTVKSFFLDYGRVAGVLLVMLMPKTTHGSIWGILILTVLQYAAVFVSSLAAKRLETYVHQGEPVA